MYRVCVAPADAGSTDDLISEKFPDDSFLAFDLRPIDMFPAGVHGRATGVESRCCIFIRLVLVGWRPWRIRLRLLSSFEWRHPSEIRSLL